jgi:AraC family transcriptional regulator
VRPSARPRRPGSPSPPFLNRRRRSALIRNVAAPARFRQLASWTEEGDDDIDVMTGVEVPDFSDLPIDLVGKSVPGCNCLVFTHRSPVTRIGDSYRGIYERWLPASDRRPALPFNFARYRLTPPAA